MSSPIPGTAQEVIDETWENGAKKSAYYEVAGQRVGYRYWSPAGDLEMEYGIEDGKRHGAYRTWHENGQLCEEATYVHGKEHGTTRQYDETGALIGTYTMVHGTGADLWFERPGVLSEERYYQDGILHSYERWWDTDNTTVWMESHYWHGVPHGIFREWNDHGRLARGFPRYFVAGQRVIKRQYERACRTDPTLPPFVAAENAPARQLPEAVRTQAEQAKR